VASYYDQMLAAKQAHAAVAALEAQVRSQVAQAFDDWDKGLLDAQTIRHRLEAIVRSAYRSSVAIGQAHAMQQSELPDWKPSERVFLTEYLKQLLADVRSNLRDYKASSRDEMARRKAVLRIQHSAGVGAERGYTDAVVAAYRELEGYGFAVRKIWLNSQTSIPCAECLALHGSQVGVDEDFPVKTSKARVYINLQGPPRHPNCRCYVCIIITTLDNATESLDIEKPQQAPTQMSSKQVRGLPSKIFHAIVKVLRKILTLGRH
jgi:hypothetical protein